jgi:transformation/transcription domain-associated protein
MVEAFASSLTVLDGFNIRKTMVPNLPIIMKELDKDPELITMFKYLLLNNGKNVSYECCDLVFSHLVDNLEVLSYINTPDDVTHLQHIDENDSNEERQSNEITLSKRGQNLYKLFIIVFSSLSKYSKNETAILPHLLTFVPDCIRRSMEGHTWPGPYLSILRMLFQTLGGKFDASNKEMLPLLPTILNGFYRIYLATKNEQLRLMIVELMLTIAPRTEIEVLPHLPLLVKVLIPALQSNRGDLVNIGLRTREKLFMMIFLCNHFRSKLFSHKLRSL